MDERTPEQILERRIVLLFNRTQGITLQELEDMPDFALAIIWRDHMRLARQQDESRTTIDLAISYLEDGAPQTALERLRAVRAKFDD